MIFLIVTHVRHKRYNGKIYGYGPYIREMNLWFRHIEGEVIVVAPIEESEPDAIDLPYEAQSLTFESLPAFNLTDWPNRFKTLALLPLIGYKIVKCMSRSDHIHLRCPGNMGLLGSILQIAFPSKKKSAKYAGNWDPDSSQPWSYRLQKKILSNPYLTRNMKALVYGEWPNQSRNVVPFFTATYSKEEVSGFKFSVFSEKDENEKPKTKNQQRKTNNEKPTTIYLLYVGTLSPNKRPVLAIETARILHEKGHAVHLDFYGEGSERKRLYDTIRKYKLEEIVTLHGNRPSEVIKKAYQKAHFLLFASRSEGWPKVVAEAMWWGCLPITTAVSCVPQMVGRGSRGTLVEPDAQAMADAVEAYLADAAMWQKEVDSAMAWSQQFTLERFEEEIGEILHDK